MKMTFFCS